MMMMVTRHLRPSRDWLVPAILAAAVLIGSLQAALTPDTTAPSADWSTSLSLTAAETR